MQTLPSSWAGSSPSARRFRPRPGLVAGEEERGQGDIRLAVGIVEPEENIGGAGGPAGEEPLGAEDQPGVAVVGMRLDVGFEPGDLVEEFGGLAVDRLDIGRGEHPAGLGGLGVAEPVGGLGEMAAGQGDLGEPELGSGLVGAAFRAWRYRSSAFLRLPRGRAGRRRSGSGRRGSGRSAAALRRPPPRPSARLAAGAAAAGPASASAGASRPNGAKKPPGPIASHADNTERSTPARPHSRASRIP